MKSEINVMRDVFIEEVYERMREDSAIFFVCADFGSPRLDRLIEDFRDRFINVGIAEQNLVNIATGLALEGFTVFAYAIAPFLTMRAYEQIRVNLSLHAQLKDINVNLVGVGAGLSYGISGPTHHCFEDITIMRTLPNFVVFSPSDWVSAKSFVDYSIRVRQPKYIRLDGQALPRIHANLNDADLMNGFKEIKKEGDVCLLSTGYMTHKAVEVAGLLKATGISVGIIDVFLMKPINEKLFFEAINKYKYLLTLEEAFIEKGGLDSLVLSLLNKNNSNIKLKGLGFKDAYVFDMGSREHLHKLNNLDAESIIREIKGLLKEA